MIPHELLREAAARTCESYVYGLLSDYNPECRYVFSADFEKKINKLKRRADHPIFYRTMRRIAIILLTLLIAGTVWISIDSDARAAFFGWFNDFVDDYFVFRHEEGANNGIKPADFRPSWLPYGYSEDSVKVFDNETTVRYKNDSGELIRFSYVITNEEIDWFFNTSKGHTQSCRVGKYDATLFVSESDDTASSLTWADSDDVAFHVTGFVSETDLIRMAESVRVIS